MKWSYYRSDIASGPALLKMKEEHHRTGQRQMSRCSILEVEFGFVFLETIEGGKFLRGM